MIGEPSILRLTRKAAALARKLVVIVVYYEALKRELKTKTIYEYRCDERLIKLT